MCQVYSGYGMALGTCYQFSINRTLTGDCRLAIWIFPYIPSSDPPVLLYQFHTAFTATGLHRIYADQLDFPALMRNHQGVAGPAKIESFLQPPRLQNNSTYPHLFLDFFVAHTTPITTVNSTTPTPKRGTAARISLPPKGGPPDQAVPVHASRLS